MADQFRESGRLGRRSQRRTAGFTLVEVLVVLAILVMLFALLFAPMITAFEEASQGQLNVRLQDATRTAMEQMKRELAQAIYVYPADLVQLGTGDWVVSTSQIAFIPPKRDGDGNPIDPLQAEMITDPNPDPGGPTVVPLSVCYQVALADSGPIEERNPPVVWREQGILRSQGPARAVSAIDSGRTAAYSVPQGTWNALTPRDGIEIPCSVTACFACATIDQYYTETCSACSSPNVMHLYRGLEFRPERICNERLEMSGDGSFYTARCGAWDGVPYEGWSLSALTAPFDPRVAVFRFSGASYSSLVFDTAGAPLPTGVATDQGPPDPDALYLAWDAGAGVVDMGNEAVARFWTPSVRDGDIRRMDYLADGTTPSATPNNDYTYLVEPAYLESAAGIPTKLVPGEVEVWWGGRRYSRTDTWQTSEIGRGEFYFDIDDSNPAYERGELRFHEFNPPQPDANTPLLVRYKFRRNFDSVTGRDDMVKVDYSTRSIMNIALIVADFLEPELRAEGETSDEVPLASKVHIGNPGR